MSFTSVDASMLKAAFLSGAKSLENRKEFINELNVFPVPDGDTGTNMTLTIMSAAKEVATMENPKMAAVTKAISSGSLRGARGNSGVILSQLLRGFAKGVGENEELTVEVFATAFERAVETAYKAVMKPKEGTILTVAKGGADKARELVGQTTDIVEFAHEIITKMQEVLDYTPELLPVLKEAGVVDSGGQGLLEFLKGAVLALEGNPIEFTAEVAPTAGATEAPKGAASNNISTADIKFGYCTEFIIMLEKTFDSAEEVKFKAFLEAIGDSIVLVADDEIVKVHVHTNDPGKAISKALTYGQLTKMKIDNMREEHNERVISAAEKASATTEAAPKKDEPRKKDGFVAVSLGDGINEIFEGLGVDYIIAGGQTMNPSTEDFLKAIDNVNADNVFIYPNNKNVILAAEQSKALVEGKNIIVIPSKTMPQGIAALISYINDYSAEDNEREMLSAMKRVKTGQVTYSVRDTSIDGFEIRENDIMGLDDKGIKAVGHDIQRVSRELTEKMMDEDSELVTIYYGADNTEEAANQLADDIREMNKNVEVEVHNGGQPIYYYMISVE